MIAEREGWHQILETLTRTPKALERLAQQLGVAPVTIQRWVKGQSSPRPQQIHRLVNALPEHASVLRNLLNQEFPPFAVTEDRSGQMSDQLTEALTTLATTPRHLHFWYVGPMMLQAILAQFDPFQQGMLVRLIQGVRPAPGKRVRSVRLTLMAANAPLRQGIIPTQLYFAGAESLVGQVISSGHALLLEDVSGGNWRLPHPMTAWAQSTVVVPLLFGGQIAGCLKVCSPTPRIFDLSHLERLEHFATLMALVLQPEEFYAPECISLALMPTPDMQQPFVSRFHTLVRDSLREADCLQRSITLVEAEQLAWQQIEEDLMAFVIASDRPGEDEVSSFLKKDLSEKYA